MRIVDIIEKKRDGEELNREQIEALILGYVKGQVPDYQVAAFLMAVVFRGMTDRETVFDDVHTLGNVNKRNFMTRRDLFFADNGIAFNVCTMCSQFDSLVQTTNFIYQSQFLGTNTGPNTSFGDCLDSLSCHSASVSTTFYK